MQIPHGRITPSLRSPGFEHSGSTELAEVLPDVASRSFRRRGEVGSTSTNAERRTPNVPPQFSFPLLNQMNSSGPDGDSSRGDPGRNWVEFIDYDSVAA